jgi:hypothetical protein
MFAHRGSMQLKGTDGVIKPKWESSKLVVSNLLLNEGDIRKKIQLLRDFLKNNVNFKN